MIFRFILLRFTKRNILSRVCSQGLWIILVFVQQLLSRKVYRSRRFLSTSGDTSLWKKTILVWILCLLNFILESNLSTFCTVDKPSLCRLFKYFEQCGGSLAIQDMINSVVYDTVFLWFKKSSSLNIQNGFHLFWFVNVNYFSSLLRFRNDVCTSMNPVTYAPLPSPSPKHCRFLIPVADCCKFCLWTSFCLYSKMILCA